MLPDEGIFVQCSKLQIMKSFHRLLVKCTFFFCCCCLSEHNNQKKRSKRKTQTHSHTYNDSLLWANKHESKHKKLESDGEIKGEKNGENIYLTLFIQVSLAGERGLIRIWYFVRLFEPKMIINDELERERDRES